MGSRRILKKIIIDYHPGQTRVALLEGSELLEIYMEDDDHQRVVGNIYRAKVCNVLPGMQAAFVDIGLDKNAFLYVGDIVTDKSIFEFHGYNSKPRNDISSMSIREVIKEGQEITVQVLKEPMGTKGARVTTHITLPGRYMVLMPTVNYVGVSRRIVNEEERQRLKSIAEDIKPIGMGAIIRTAAEGRDSDEFVKDFHFLRKLWEQIQEKEYKGKVPRLLHRDESLIYRTVRDLFTHDIDELIINNDEQHEKILKLMEVITPRLKNKVKFFNPHLDVFEYYEINTKIERAIQKKVWLHNGGYLIIDQTEALTVIDVNTGKYVGTNSLEDTVLKTNLNAAVEIAHQLRLRDIGGIIVIDFIDMMEDEHQNDVLTTLRNALKEDRTKTNVIGFTGLGLVEMTRKKVKARLSATLLKPCPYCNGTGRVYSEMMVIGRIEKELEHLFHNSRLWGALIEMHPVVAEVWSGNDAYELEMLEKSLDRRLFIRSNKNIHIEDFKVHPIKSEDEIDAILMEYADEKMIMNENSDRQIY